MSPPPHNKQWYIWDRIDTFYYPICYDNMFNNAFKSLFRFLKENGFPYKWRLYGNSQFVTNCYTVVLYYRMFKYSLRKKISFATFGVSIDDFFTRYAGLGYSLIQYFLKIIVYDHSIFIIDQHNKAIGIINIAKPFLNFMDETMI